MIAALEAGFPRVNRESLRKVNSHEVRPSGAGGNLELWLVEVLAIVMFAPGEGRAMRITCNKSPSHAYLGVYNPMKFKCLVVEDQVMFLELLLIALRGISRLEVSRTARTFAEASRLIREERYDIAILDYMLPDGSGMDLARELGEISPDTVVVLLTAHIKSLLPQEEILGAARIRAVVDKVGSLDSLRAEIEAFIRERDPEARAQIHPESALSRRELEIFKLVGGGVPNKQIAAQLFISQRTVESHRKTISRKMGMSGSELVSCAALFVPGRKAQAEGGGLPR